MKKPRFAALSRAASLAFALMASAPVFAKGHPTGLTTDTPSRLVETPSENTDTLNEQTDKSLVSAEKNLNSGQWMAAMRDLLLANDLITVLEEPDDVERYTAAMVELLEKVVTALEPKVATYIKDGEGALALEAIEYLEKSTGIKNFLKNEQNLKTLTPLAHGAAAKEMLKSVKLRIDQVVFVPQKVPNDIHIYLNSWNDNLNMHIKEAGGADNIPGLDRDTQFKLQFKAKQAYAGILYQRTRKFLSQNNAAEARTQYQGLADLIWQRGAYKIYGFRDKDINTLNAEMSKAIPGFIPRSQLEPTATLPQSRKAYHPSRP